MSIATTRRRFLKETGLIAAAGATGLWSCVSRVEQSTQQIRCPNIVLIITDDQGYGDLGCHGNDKIRTPHIDRLSQQGVQFSRYYVCPVCAPTRASLLTGRYNYRTGVIDTYLGRAMMHPDEVTLAQVLQAAGYRTGIFGKWHLGDNYPLRPQDRGFDEVLIHRGGGMVQPGDPPGSRYMDPILQHNGQQKTFKGYCTDVFTDGALRFIEQNRRDPFFVYLPTNAPHTPLQVPDEWVKPYRDMGLDDTTAKIYAMVENVDANVGRVLQKLADLGLEQDTIVLFMTDNGPQQKRYNAGMRGLKGSVYDGGIRVPLLIRWPGKLQPGQSIDRIAAHIDIMPTLLELCGIAQPSNVQFDGTSLTPLLRDPEPPWPDRTLFFQWHRGDQPIPYKNCAVRTQRYKLVEGRELYDMNADPAEQHNIADQRPQVVAQLRAQYDRWFADVTANHRYLPPRIILGSEQENPSILTRQDWRGPRAGWAPDSLGYWEVQLSRSGRYTITLRFAPLKASAEARLQLCEVSLAQPLKEGADRCTFSGVQLPAGPGRLEASILSGGKAVGVEYVEVTKLD